MRLIRVAAILALHDLSIVPPNLLPNIPIRLATLILQQLNPILPGHNPNRKLVQRPGVLFPRQPLSTFRVVLGENENFAGVIPDSTKLPCIFE